MRIEKDNFFTKEDAVIIRWIAALAMASNDLSFCAKIIDTNSNYEKIYYFRLALAYLREIAKVVWEAKKNGNINSFISGLSKEAQDSYSNIMQFLSSYEKDSFVQKNLKGPRDEIFHYPDVKGEYFKGLFDDIIALNKIHIELSGEGTIADIRYIFIDEVLWKRAKPDSLEIVNQLSKITVGLFSFLDCVFDFLIKNRKI